jgi:transposase
MNTSSPTSSADESEMGRPSRAEQQRLARCQQRRACYQQIHQLRQQGWSVPAIVGEVGVSKRTVQRFLRAQQFPERSRRRRQPRNTDRYEVYLRQRLAQGCQNATQLYRELKAQGYAGSYMSVYKALQSLTPHSPHRRNTAAHKEGAPSRAGLPVPSSRSVAWWLQGHFCTSKPEVAQQQQGFIAHLVTLAPVLQEAAELAQAFIRLLKNHVSEDLDAWLKKAGGSACSEIKLFAQGLSEDLAAVENAVRLKWSNGPTEGHVNRLKMLKRQMYGRASFGLLRRRVLLA